MGEIQANKKPKSSKLKPISESVQNVPIVNNDYINSEQRRQSEPNTNILNKVQTNYNTNKTNNDITKSKTNINSETFKTNKKVAAELIDMEVPKEQVELYFYLLETNLSENNMYKIRLDLLTKKSKNLQLGFTNEKEGGNGRIDFEKTYIFDYYFEIQQTLKIQIIQSDRPRVAVETSVGKIMGAKGQHQIIEFKSNGLAGKLCIQGNSVKTTDYKFNLDISIDFGNDILAPYYIVKRNLSKLIDNEKPNWIKAYKSENLINYPKEKKFNSINLNTQFLCNSELDRRPILLEFYDFDGKLIGYFSVTIEKILDIKTLYLDNEGLLRVNLNCTCKKQYKFLDYLRGGTQVSMMVGIDFTASNGQPTDRISLHSLKHQPNLYEKAIDSCCSIVAFYDSDQLFPVFGYGALIGATNKVNHCFPINLSDDPNIFTVQGILETYRHFINDVKLYGPTYFGPLIEHCNEIAQKGNLLDTYYIMIILTDGIINDMQNAIDAIVEATFLPISIIIIGVGPGGDNGFREMEDLDADDYRLCNSNGIKAKRDIVQFVEFQKFDNNPKLLAEAVLEENFL